LTTSAIHVDTVVTPKHTTTTATYTLSLHDALPIFATAQQSLQAGAEFFRQHGITPVILGDSVTGEASEVAKVYGALARQVDTYGDRKSTRLNSSHVKISYAVFCLKKKTKQ